MAAQRAEGIILRKYCLRETSYILSVFTKEFGKIKGVIKGVRSPYPQFAGNFEIFTQCQLLFYRKRKRTMDLITQCETLDFFLPVRKDIERVSYANYFIELVDIVTNDYDANEELYRTLAASLRMLGTGLSARRISRIFELKLLKVLGLSPQVTECTKCRMPAGDKILFSVKDGGILCRACGKDNKRNIQISKGTVNFVKKIQESDFNKTLHVKVSREVGKEIEIVLKKFLAFYINHSIKSLKFIERLERI